MSRGYLQIVQLNSDCKNGKVYVYLAGGTVSAEIYDPVSGDEISNPVDIDSQGYVQAFHVETETLYDIKAVDFLGATKLTRQNVSVVGGGTGSPGPQGIQGVKGDKGDKGDTGATGQNGIDGTDGVDGTDGEDGVSLVSIRVDETSTTGRVIYNKSDAPSNWIIAGDIMPNGIGQIKIDETDSLGYLGAKLEAGDGISIGQPNSTTQLTISNTAPETYRTQASQYATVKDFLNGIIEGTSGVTVTTSADFNKIIISGAGIGGSGFNPRGSWNGSTTYDEGDGVWYYDSSVTPVINRYYVATATNTNVNPYTDGTGWVMMFSIDQLGDQMVKLDNDDSTTGFLLDKIVAGTGITFTRTIDAGGDFITIDGAPVWSIGVNGVDKTIADVSNVLDFVDGEVTEVIWDGSNIRVDHDTYQDSGTAIYQTATGLPKFDQYGHYKGTSDAIEISDVSGLESALSTSGDGTVAVQAGDSKGYIEDKIIVAGAIDKATVGSPSNKYLQLIGTGEVSVSNTDSVGFLEDKIIAGDNVSITVEDEGTTYEKLKISAVLPESTPLYAGKFLRYQKHIDFTNISGAYSQVFYVGAISSNWLYSGSDITDMTEDGSFLANYNSTDGIYTLSKEGIYNVVFSAHAFLVSGTSYPCYFNCGVLSSYDNFVTSTIENSMQLTLETPMVYQDNMDNLTISALINNSIDGLGRLKKFKVYVTAVAFSGTHRCIATFRNSYISIVECAKPVTGPQGPKGDQGDPGVVSSLDSIPDVDVTGATDGQVLTYDLNTATWIPTTVSGGGSDTYTVKVDTNDTNPSYLSDKIAAATGSPLTVNVVGDTLILDAIESDITDPLIQTIGLMNENGTMGFTGNAYSNVYADGEWETGFGQNTSDAYYRVSTIGRGTINKVKFYVSAYNDVDYGIAPTGNYGAIRIGLFDLNGVCKGQTEWTRGLQTLGTVTLPMTPCPGKNLTLERNGEYWIGIVARGMQLIAYNKTTSGFDPGVNALRYAVSIRSTSGGANWSPNFWDTTGGGFIQVKVPCILMASTES